MKVEQLKELFTKVSYLENVNSYIIEASEAVDHARIRMENSLREHPRFAQFARVGVSVPVCMAEEAAKNTLIYFENLKREIEAELDNLELVDMGDKKNETR